MESNTNTINLGTVSCADAIKQRVIHQHGNYAPVGLQPIGRTPKNGLEEAKHRKMGGRINHTGLALCGKRYG